MLPVSAIKLIRTDTTLDLSQKAEKGMNIWIVPQLGSHLFKIQTVALMASPVK